MHTFLQSAHAILEMLVNSMSDKKITNVYGDGNIPDIDLPQDNVKNIKISNKQENNSKSSHSENGA